MQKVKVSAVSYSNAIPFVYGLMHSPVIAAIDLSLDVPAECADKFNAGKVDVGLIPVVELLHNQQYEIISNYCIGANGNVRTVSLYCQVPVEEVNEVYLDFQSRTSVRLARVLAENYWSISPVFRPANPGFEKEVVGGKAAAVVIGDRNFSLEDRYLYQYDLAQEWKKFTGMSFVFALWTSRISLPVEFKHQFNKALAYGLEHVREAVQMFSNNSLTEETDLIRYLTQNIDYIYDIEKKEAMNLFFSYVSKLSPELNIK